MTLRSGSSFHWSRSLSDRVRGMRDGALSIVWKKRREQKLREIEARQICQFLCIAGFPQYVQMFQGNCGPINLAQVEKDHQFLDAMSLKLLLNQIAFLNQLTSQKISLVLSKEELAAGSDDEDNQVLSDQWTCQAESGRRWVHKFLPQSRITSSHRKLSCSNSYDSAMAASKKMANIKPISHCSSDERSTSVRSSGGGSEAKGPVKVRSSSLSGKAVKRSSFFSRDRSRTPCSRGSSVSDSEPSSESSLMSSSWSGMDRSSKLRSSLRNVFRRGENRRSLKVGTNHGRPPNAPLSGKLDIGSPVIIGTPEIKEKMDRLNCVDISPTADQALTTENAKSSAPVASVCNNKLDSSCQSNCLRVNGHQSPLACYPHNSRILPESVDNYFNDDIELNTTIARNLKLPSPPASCTVGDSVVSSDSAHENALLCMKETEDHSTDDHLSIYDNLSCSFESKGAKNPQLELDLILDELYRNIESLNETLQDVENPHSEDADSNSVFEDVSPSHSGNKVPLLPHSNHISDLSIPITNGILSSGQSNIKYGSDSDIIYDNYRPGTFDTTSGLNSSEPNKDIPSYLLGWKNKTKDQSTVIPGSVKCTKNRNNNSTGKIDDGFRKSSAHSERLETIRQSSRWESFSRDHQLSFKMECGNLSCMTACQMTLLYKLNLVKLTSILENYVPSIPLSWFRSKSKPVSKCPQCSGGVFGRPLMVNLLEMDCPLPTWVIYAMQRIRRSAAEAVGVFRKSGVRSRIQQFRDQIQSDSNSMNFDSLQIYDVADLLKLYFRELPECLLTRPLSQVFISIFRNVPKELRLDSIRAGIVLMPDENREVLQCLLFLLLDLSEFSHKNQMTASNLAICFAPSLFHVYGARESSPKLSANPPKTKETKAGGAGGAGAVNGGCQKLSPPVFGNELHEQLAAQECLTFMISNAKELFSVSSGFLEQCSILQLDSLPFIHPFEKSSLEIYKAHLQQMISDILQDSSENFKGWSSLERVNSVELSYKKQEHPLRLWKCCVEVSGSPKDVLTRIQKERHLWDGDLIEESVVAHLGPNMDVYRYAFTRMPPQVPWTCCVLRLWDTMLPNDACILVSASIKHLEAMTTDGINGTVFTSSYLIESRGKEKSQVIFISRVDLRGYSPQWYRKAYGHLCVNLMNKLRDSLNSHRQTKV